MLVPEPSGRIHVAFDDRRAAVDAGPVRRIIHGDRLSMTG